jgi:uncharacterized membrane protein
LAIRTLLVSVALCLLPVSELRGGLPFALASGIPLAVALPVCLAANALVAPLVYLFLSTLHKLLSRWPLYLRFYNAVLARARSKVHAAVEKYGYWGLALFVAIPLPITGAYTGTLGAWVLGMQRRKTLLAVTAGVVVAGVIVATVTVLGIKALYLFVK